MILSIGHPFATLMKNWHWELLVFFAGMISVRGLPPHHEQMTMMLALAVLILAIHRVSRKRGARLGFLFGLGHHFLGFSWLLTSLHQHGNLPMGVALLVLALLAAVMALYVAVFGGLLTLLAPRPGLLPLAAPSLWVVCEWLRSHLFSGFPWNLVGYGWNNQERIMQVADLGGVLLLSWFMVFPAAIMTWIFIEKFNFKTLIWGVTLILASLLLTTGYGLWRSNELSALQEQDVWTHPLKVALIQGNVEQVRKWDPKYREEGFSKYLKLTGEINELVDLVIWPETAIAYFLQASPESQKRIVAATQRVGAPILTGAPMADRGKDGQWLFYNSMILLDESGSLTRRYNKYHLVPFGEYIPFRNIMPGFIKKMTVGTEDFSHGPGPIPLPWEHGAIGALVCYETIFPHEVRDLARASARWLVNVTNDAWFGESAKPQHLAMARFRAVENRLPMIRVANTGISAVFDSLGRELGRIPPNRTGTLVVKVHQGLGRSFFQKTEPWWIGLWLYMCATAWLMGLKPARKWWRKSGATF
ncbi:MAG: apolipoprotein N-acyltransferase [Magnetococcales bacterium]|nr:apolipoprotein N-acyltransferase [Magnetococcales bacterium]